MKVLLGILIGIAIVRMVRHMRWRRHGWGGWGGHGCGHRHRNGHRLMWMLRELDLDPRQQDELKEIWHQVRRTIGDVQFGRWRTMSNLVDVATVDPLDGGRLDELATAYGEAQSKAASEVASLVKRVHGVLRPEQRVRLRELAERSGLWRFPRAAEKPPGDGPYRV